MSSWFQNARIDRIFPSSSKVMTSMGAMVRVCSPELGDQREVECRFVSGNAEGLKVSFLVEVLDHGVELGEWTRGWCARRYQPGLQTVAPSAYRATTWAAVPVATVSM